MINIQCPINNLGYGIAGYNILKEIYARNKHVSLYTIGQPEFVDEIITVSMNNVQHLWLDRPFVKIWHQHDLIQRIGRGKYHGFPIFELTNFNPQEKLSLQHCDGLLVCSNWAKNIIDPLVNADSHVVPLGVDTTIFYPVKNLNSSKTIFLNCGKWEKRKGHDILIECFNQAFEPSDFVELWMMCDNPFIGEQNQSWQGVYKKSKLGDKIKFIPRQTHHTDVARLMNMADCGVFPSRGEGWNLELLEMMACGKHVIATNYSAHTEFCNSENCLLVEIDNLETAFDGVFFDGKKGMWAEISKDQKDQLIHHMQHVHMLKQEFQLGSNTAGIKTANEFTWENTVDKLLESIDG